MSDWPDQISRRAHELWEAEGRPHGRDREHWLQAEQEIGAAQSNEGEGNRTATRRYNAKTTRFAESGQVEAKAREVVSGPEGEELRRAEAAGKRRSRGEDPAVRRATR